MKEKIARVIAEASSSGLAEVYWADKILSLIREEIEKVENPYPKPKGKGVIMLDLEKQQREGFEECRQKILDLLSTSSKE